MSDAFPNHSNLFRLVMEDEHGTVFQWRGPYTTADAARNDLEDADKDHPEAGTPWVEELMKEDPDEDGVVQAAQWEKVD